MRRTEGVSTSNIPAGRSPTWLASSPQAATAGRPVVATRRLNQEGTILDENPGPVTDNGHPLPPTTRMAAEKSRSLANRSLDEAAHCVLVGALSKLAANKFGETSTGISHPIKVSDRKFAATWKTDEPAQASARLILDCEVPKNQGLI